MIVDAQTTRGSAVAILLLRFGCCGGLGGRSLHVGFGLGGCSSGSGFLSSHDLWVTHDDLLGADFFERNGEWFVSHRGDLGRNGRTKSATKLAEVGVDLPGAL